MNLLLDTHIALWAVTDDARLPTKARDLIVDPDNDVWVSAASVWEIAIKHAKTAGRPGGLKVSSPRALRAQCLAAA
jgi:PIN domain nuclease of toxin-antitoxin system